METAVNTQILSAIFLLGAAAVVLYYFYHTKAERNSGDSKSYLLALKYIAENDSRRAIEQLKETVRADTNNIDAYLKLGDILRREGLPNNAIRIHEDLTLRAKLNKEDEAKIWFSLGLDYRAAGKFDKAESCFNRLKENADFSERVILILIKVYEQTDQYDKAFDLLKESRFAAEEENKHRLAMFKVFSGKKLADAGDDKAARIAYKEALKHNPACIFAHLYLGDSYAKNERVDDALEIWVNFCQKFPEKSYLMFSRLEKAWFDKGQYNKIAELYESILKADPKNIHALLALSSILRKKEEYSAAVSLVKEGMRQEIEIDKLTAEAARIYWDEEKYKEAAEKALLIMEKCITSGITFSCDECAHQEAEPFLKCPECGAVNKTV